MPSENQEQSYGREISSRWLAAAFTSTDTYYDHNYLRYQGFEVPLVRRLLQPIPEPEGPWEGDVGKRRAYVWLEIPSAENLTCNWNIDGYTTTQNCDERISVGMRRGESTTSISVFVPESNTEYSLSGVDTFIEERLILTLGDSYSSGEGVPDFAALTRFDFRDRRGTDSATSSNPPIRIERIPALGAQNTLSPNAAYWMDRTCHRSFLSAPSRAAIHFASYNPRVEVVHINLACSGAEVLSGVLGTYSGTLETSEPKRILEREINGDRPDLWRTNLSQINQAILLLCANPKIEEYIEEFNAYYEQHANYFSENFNRFPDDDPFLKVIECESELAYDVDLITLSIIGNDVGFMGNVHWFMQSWFECRGSGLCQDPEETAEQAAEITIPLYERLNESLTEHLGVSSEQILGTTYPIGTQDDDGSYCSGGYRMQTFNVFQGAGPLISRREMQRVTEIAAEAVNTKIEEAGRLNRWQILEASSLFDGHGWCAGEEELYTGGNPLNAYTFTTRRIRTSDDAVASQNQSAVDYERQRGRRVSRMLSTYGVMHPNGLGAAAWADLYLDAYEEMLN
ncbi:hypothetical protein ABWH92_02000 [Ahrensia marina]|uniref:hypothetical protein n=1 Tax=Ahrensia marina TaxID=1514904 RepID=UPI0035CF00EF